MWPFSKKKFSLIESGLFEGLTDCHSHILPGVDDGVKAMDESLHTLQELQKLGISELWLTPHIMEDYPNTPSDLKRRFEELKVEMKKVGCNLTVHLAAENMLDNLFVKRFEADELLPILDDEHLLVETSYFNPPYQLYELLEDILRKGYTPLLAHPERYVYMHTSDYDRLKGMNVEFRLNLLSLCGAYGGTAQHKAMKLLHSGFYSYVGSDLHNLEDFQDYINDKCLVKEDIAKIREFLS